MSEPRLSRRPDRHAPCPACGPHRRTQQNRERQVLGLWRQSDGSWISWCVRCGFGAREAAPEFSPAQTRAQAGHSNAARARRASWIWSLSEPLEGTPVETYLREGRGISCVLPASLRYLPARGAQSHAMIAAFGTCEDPEPGLLLPPEQVTAVHLTRLAADGRVRTGKTMLGLVSGQPIMLAAPNDALGLVIAEGIEDALSLHQATGLGAWAAGSAGHMAKLAAAVPDYVDCVSILADADPSGERGATALLAGLEARGLNARITGLPVNGR